MYELAFTVGFQDGLNHMPNHVVETLTRFITQLRIDPFQKLPQAKKLKNSHDRFRARIAGDFRAIYRIERSLKRIVLLTIASRQHVYRDPPSGKRVLTAEEASEVERKLGGAAGRAKSNPPPSAPDVSTDQEVVVEHVVEWITDDELALLKIDPTYRSLIIEASDASLVDSSVVPKEIIDRVYDYATNPASSHIGKLYSASGAGDIARLPLKSFMLALDKEQQRVISVALDAGPLLVKGGPGTGKSLVGLYRMRHIVEHRAAESMFSSSPRFGILTYTNTLADLNETLSEEISKMLSGEGEVVCSTLDKISYRLAKEALGRQPNPKSDAQIAEILQRVAIPKLENQEREIIARLSIEYVVGEIEKVILGYGIASEAEYLAHDRAGRRVPMNANYRRAVWALYSKFLNIHAKENFESWGLLRKIALEHLSSTKIYPRFNALFVDEVQDLSRTSRRLMLGLVSDKRFLLMTADTGQSIYEHPPTWKETDPTLNLKGNRTFVLRRNYRTTRENYQAIAALRLESDDGEGGTGRPMPVYSGDLPVWLLAKAPEQLSKTADVIRQLTKMHELGQIAVIVRDNTQLREYTHYLQRASIAAKPVTRDSKIDVHSPHVHVITAHSAKGLEFPAVIVPDVADDTYPLGRTMDRARTDEEVAEIVELEQRLLYVALSRACHSLVLIENSDRRSRFLNLLDPELWRDAL